MTRENSRRAIAEFARKAFTPREIFFRSGDRFHHIRFSSRLQQLAAMVGFVLVCWGGISSATFFLQRSTIAAKDVEIERQNLNYFDLLAEVGEYHNQFVKITTDLEQNQEYLLSILEQNPEDHGDLSAIRQGLKTSRTEQARVVIARAGLREKMTRFEGNLREIAKRNMSLQAKVSKIQARVKSSNAERDLVAAARAQLVQRLAVVERTLEETTATRVRLDRQVASLLAQLGTSERKRQDLRHTRSRLTADIDGLQDRLGAAGTDRRALEGKIASLGSSLTQSVARTTRLNTERDYLQRRVGGLEQRLVDLRDAGQGVIGRLSEHTQLSIDVVEKTIKMTGLDLNLLVAEIGNGSLGQGGPFVPAGDGAAEFEPSTQLEATVNGLDRQIDRWAALQGVVRGLPLTAPLAQFRISSRYGTRRDPVNGRKAKHLGVDFAAPRRSSIYATAPGKVVFAGWRGRYGRTVEIDHGNGVRTRYGHMRKILVKTGQEVGHREKIGLVGSSGRSTGSHVHYEVRYKGRAYNPMKFVEAGNYVFKG